MADIPNVHIYCSYPEGSHNNARFLAAARSLEKQFPKTLSAGVCPSPFTEICGFKARRTGIQVSVSYEQIPLEAHLEESLELIADAFRKAFGKDMPIIVRDCERRFRPVCSGAIPATH